MIVALKERYNHWLENQHNGEILFFSGYILYLFWKIIKTTMFPYSDTAFMACLAISVLLLSMKIVLFDTYTPRMFLTVAVIFACGLVVAVSSGYLWPFIWSLVVVSAKDIPFRKILQVYLLMNLVIMGLAFCASLLGVVENLAYTSSDAITGIRYSFGCTYTTDFAAHVFFMLMVVFYLYYKQLKWYHYIGTCAIAGLIFYFCYAKLDTVCILLLALFFGIYHILRWQGERENIYPEEPFSRNCGGINFKRTRFLHKWESAMQKIASASMPVVCIIMYYLTVSYDINDETSIEIDEFITSRLRLGYKGLKDFGISLFGQDVPMVGFGGATKLKEEYFFVDCSYLFVMLRYGIVFMVLVFIVYAAICYKRREDTALMICLIILAISFAIDHHILEEAYNPFGYALFAGDVLFGRTGVVKPGNNMGERCLLH